MPWVPAEAFKDIARGNVAAEDFMGKFYIWTHKQDDLFDRDKPVSAEISASFDLALLQSFSSNPFFQENQLYLWPVIQMGALAWIASEDAKKSEDVITRITSQVLKSQYQDVFFAVAYCLGGFSHALAMTRKYRDYHFDDTPRPSSDKI